MCSSIFICSSLQAHYFTKDELRERNAILQTINYYFESVNIGAPAEVRKAYHPQATFAYIDNKTRQVKIMPVRDFFAKIDADTYVNYERNIRLKTIDITGDAALVETEIDYVQNGKKLYDYLSLLKIDGRWQIVSRLSYKEYASFYNQPSWGISELDKEKIHYSLKNYLKGGDKCDLEKMQKALHDEVSMAYLEDHSERLKLQSRDTHLREYAKKSDRHLKRNHIVEFVHTKGNIAVAKVSVRFKDYKATLTDYISLIKEGEDWKIIRKVSNKEKMKYISSL